MEERLAEVAGEKTKDGDKEKRIDFPATGQRGENSCFLFQTKMMFTLLAAVVRRNGERLLSALDNLSN